MESITFHCKVITPMFLAGADGQTPELRAPSIKGAMRFWWRAMNGHLPLNKLKEKEEGIFGGANKGGKSRVLIRVLNSPIETSVIEMLPHKKIEKQRSPRQCFPEGGKFEIKISLLPNESIQLKQVKCLFELCAFLGGLGKRSRRGLGSFQILEINGEEYKTDGTLNNIEGLIKEINPDFSYSLSANYPIIQEIEISKSNVSFFQIGKATHDVKDSNNSFKYEATLGAGKPRFASPIYISTLPSGKVIVTTLQTISPKRRDVDMGIQLNLKKRILS